jgi:hypothetical protein
VDTSGKILNPKKMCWIYRLQLTRELDVCPETFPSIMESGRQKEIEMELIYIMTERDHIFMYQNTATKNPSVVDAGTIGPAWLFVLFDV